MSSVLKIKKGEQSFLFLSRGGLIVLDIQVDYSQIMPGVQPTVQIQTVFISEKFGNLANSTLAVGTPTPQENKLVAFSVPGQKKILEEGILTADFSNYIKIEELSKLERYYLGMLKLQEGVCRDDPNLFSIDDLSFMPKKFMLAADYNGGLNSLDQPTFYSLFECSKNNDWFSQVPGAFLSQERAKIISVKLEEKNYSILADWDENLVDECDIVQREVLIKTRIGPEQIFVPTIKTGTITSPSDQLIESADVSKYFMIQPKIDGFAVNNFFKIGNQGTFVGSPFLNQLGIDVFIDCFNLDGVNEFVVYYRLLNSSQDKEYSINIYDSNTLIYHGEISSSGDKIIISEYLKKPNFLYVEVLENKNKKIFQKELVSYRYTGKGYGGISLRDQREAFGEFEFDIELNVRSEDIWTPIEKSLDDIDLSNPATDEQIKNAQLTYQVVITKIFDGKFFDEEIIFVNRNSNGFFIEGADGSDFEIIKESSNKRLVKYKTKLPAGGSVVLLANVRVYPVSMYLYEKKDFFLEYIDLIERGNTVIPKRKKLYFRDHPSNAIKVSPHFNTDTRENVRFLQKTGTSKKGIVLYENHESSYAAIPASSDQRFEELVNISIVQKNLYYESNIAGSIHPQVLPYQIIDIEVDDELKPQITKIELYSCVHENNVARKLRLIGSFIPTATIRAVDFSSAAIMYSVQINHSELPFEQDNPPEALEAVIGDSFLSKRRVFSQFNPTDRHTISYKVVIQRDSIATPIEVDSSKIELPSIRLPEPIIYNRIEKMGPSFELQSE